MSNSVNLALDVTKTGIQNPLIKVRQGDGGFETLHTTVTSNGEPLDLQGWTITFMGTTAGNHKIIDANVTVVEAPNGIFDYTPSKAWGMDIGEFKIAYFKFVKGDGSASSANFRVSVIEAVDLTQDEAQHYISVVDATIAEAREHLESSLADVSSSVAATSLAASSMAVFVSSTASSAVSQVNSAASNASSVASNAVASVSAASNTYFKNARILPDDAHDFAIIASDTIKYQGIWYTGSNSIANGPTNNWIWNTVEVIGGRGSGSGIIRTASFPSNQEYITTVDNGKIMGWKKVADDAQLAHKTGTETIAGDKTFTSPINGQLSGNAATATKWQTARTLALTGDVTGSVAVDGSGDVSMATTGTNLVHKTGTETIADNKTFTGIVTVSGALDANQKVYTRTVGSTNDLQIIYTRAGNVVTGRFIAKTAGTFSLTGNDGYKSMSGYPVNAIGLNVDAFFTTDNKFITRSATEGNFVFITSDAIPTN